MLTKIGDYVAGELSSEESRQIERFILESAERRRLAEAYARMLALLRATGKEKTPDSLEAALNCTILRAVKGASAELTRRSELAKDE